MTLGEYLRLVLPADPGIRALVLERVYSEVLPQKPKLPAVVFNVISGDEDYALDGPTGIGVRRVQVDAWAATRAEATKLGLAIRTALSGKAGAAGGLEVQSVFHLMEAWDFEEETGLFRTVQDFEFHFTGESA